jgi:hypothetical protein
MLWGFLRKRGNTALFRCRSGSLFFIIAGLVTLEIIIEALILMPAIFSERGWERVSFILPPQSDSGRHYMAYSYAEARACREGFC